MQIDKRMILPLVVLAAFSGVLIAQSDAVKSADGLIWPIDIPVVVVKYFPLDGDKIDVRVTGDWGETLASTRDKVERIQKETIAALEEGSGYHGYKNPDAKPSLRYKVVESREFLEPLPVCPKRQGDEVPMTDYNAIFERIDGKTWVQQKGVKEIWLFGYHGGVVGLWESNMAGPFGDTSNSNRDQNDLPVLDRTYTVYHYNYQRDTGEAVEDHLHQFEALFNEIDGRDRTPANEWPNLLFWGKFVGSDRSHKMVPVTTPDGRKVYRCGWTHYAPNSEQDYDWSNPRIVETDIEDWRPDGIGATIKISSDRWQRNDLKWKIYWMQNLPGADHGLSYKGRPLTNWWRFVGDWDQARRNKITLAELAVNTQAAVLEITRDVLLDHLYGGWMGMLIGGIEGLPHENKYVDQPRESLPEFDFLPDGARSDDDNDFELTHLYFMDQDGALKLPYPRIAEIWKANMNTGIWIANAGARKLMGAGLLPPQTGLPEHNPPASYNLSGQFCVEVYGMIAPDMPRTAAELGDHYAHIAVSGEPIQATQFWTSLISISAFGPGSTEDRIRRALAAVDPKSAMAQVTHDAIAAWRDLPDDWKAARQAIYRRWLVEKKWNWNSTPTNGGLVLLALLYGGEDFVKTLQYAMAMGLDADCNAATAGAVLGARMGYAKIAALSVVPIPDRYRNRTRPQLPAEMKISEQAELLLRVCRRVILENGGQEIEINGKPGFRITTQDLSVVEPLIP